MNTVVTYVRCPYCREQWVREDDDNELVCESCRSLSTADVAVAHLLLIIEKLSKLPPTKVKHRLSVLKYIQSLLTKLISEVEKT